MRTKTPFFITLFCTFVTASISAHGQFSTDAADLPIRYYALESKIFGNVRTVRVLLPPRYHDQKNADRRYPVLYLNDGQNLFDKATSVFNSMEWGVDETLARLYADRSVSPLIVVGIDNAGRMGRANEYLPYPDEFLSPPLANPQGDLYPKFLVEEVMPFVARRFRIRSGRSNTSIGGSSYGALAALYTYGRHPNTFGRLLIESPSLYVSNGKIFDELKPDIQGAMTLPEKIYIGVGTNEIEARECKTGDQGGEAVSDVRRLERLLRENGMPQDRIFVVVEECAVHDEQAWGRRLPTSMKFLYAR